MRLSKTVKERNPKGVFGRLLPILLSTTLRPLAIERAAEPA